jgi:hypothetical protein
MLKKHKKTVRSAWILALFLLVSMTYANQPLVMDPDEVPRYQPRYFPFDGGEKASYRASWNGIPVALAHIQTTPLLIEGKKFYQVKVEARTSKILDLIWRMRDSISSTFEAKTLAPLRFVFNQKENKKVTDTRAEFDPKLKKWIVQRQRGRKVRNFEFDSPNTLDPITAAYLARSLDLKVGDRLYFNVFGGKSRYLLDLSVEGREQIQLDAGNFDAFKVVPRITNITKQGYAGRVREATVWISADEKRTPLMIASKVFIGTVYIEMLADRQGSHPAGLEANLPPS